MNNPRLAHYLPTYPLHWEPPTAPRRRYPGACRSVICTRERPVVSKPTLRPQLEASFMDIEDQDQDFFDFGLYTEDCERQSQEADAQAVAAFWAAQRAVSGPE